MKRLSRFAVVLMVLAIAASASGVALAQTHTFRFGHNNAVTHPVNLAAEQFAKRVKERTNGQIVIQVYPAAQLGDERQLGEALQVGTVDMMWSSGPMLGRYVPPFNGLEGGYLFRDQEHLFKVVRGPIGKELNEQLIKGIGVRVLDYHFAGERHLTTSNKPVRVPADLKGMLIRVPQLDNYMATFKALGASTVGIAFNETYMALKMGVAEGQENPISSIYAMKFHEVQKYINLTSHIFATGIYSMNNKKFLALPANFQAILIEEAASAGEYASSLYNKQADELVPELKKSLTFVEVDKAAFQKAAQTGGMDEWFVKQFGKEMYQRIKDTK
jgi:tripartite ATP-independent transporter DctP family solute receptor